MTLRRSSSRCHLVAATFSFAASIPKTILPDNVVLCEPGAGCVNKTLYGRNYKVLATPRFTVMVSISREGNYTRADVSVTNNTDMPLSISPEDFRVEVVTPKPKVLLYVPPAELILPPLNHFPRPHPLPPIRPPGTPCIPISGSLRPDTAANPAPAAPNRATGCRSKRQGLAASCRQSRRRQNLSATSIPPNEVTRGRVYFECDKKAHLVNVVMPIAGLVFEFPYSMKR